MYATWLNMVGRADRSPVSAGGAPVVSVLVILCLRLFLYGHDGSSGDGAVEDASENTIELVQRDLLADGGQIGRFQICGQSLPYRSPPLDGCLHGVNAEQRNPPKDERQHRRGKIGSAGETGRRHCPL